MSDREHQAGRLIINADDWGRDRDTTDATRECAARGTVSSVSAMVFMEDSERAAALAGEHRIDAGLHLNLTNALTARGCPAAASEHQQRVAAYLLRHPMARVFFHPGLIASFKYVVAAQLDEYCRLYGARPRRIDGHHHMHLSANVLFGGVLPPGTIVRRNFTFRRGEKSFLNRFYRRAMDRHLGRDHCLVDFLFSLPPLEPVDRLRRAVALARQHVVELETHPVNSEEHRFLVKGGILEILQDIPIASYFDLPERTKTSGSVAAKRAQE